VYVKEEVSLNGQKIKAWNRKRSFQSASEEVSEEGESECESAMGTDVFKTASQREWSVL